MNWVDIVIIIVIAIPALMGWRKGVISLVFTLIGVIAGIILAGQLWDTLAPMIPVDDEGVQKLLAFVVIFAVVMVVAMVAAKFLKALLTVLLLGWVDKVAGLGIGAIGGAFAATALISAMGVVPVDSVQDAITDATLTEPLSDNLGFVRGLLPDEFDAVEDLLNRGKDLLSEIDQIRSLIDKGESLLGAGEADFQIGWEGFDDFVGSDIIVVFVPESAGVDGLGPLETAVLPGGLALLNVTEGFDDDERYDIYYYVDGNDNGACDPSNDTDPKGRHTAQPGVVGVGTTYASTIGVATDGYCDNF